MKKSFGAAVLAHDDLSNLDRVQGESVGTALTWNFVYRAFYERFTLNPLPSRIADFFLSYAILAVGPAVLPASRLSTGCFRGFD
ncbi:MAG: hypothetical protein LAO79_25675 [Acidobacteriia bacterium]|nr:hypothetical protein [Terriglobia bacterium]